MSKIYKNWNRLSNSNNDWTKMSKVSIWVIKNEQNIHGLNKDEQSWVMSELKMSKVYKECMKMSKIVCWVIKVSKIYKDWNRLSNSNNDWTKMSKVSIRVIKMSKISKDWNKMSNVS